MTPRQSWRLELAGIFQAVLLGLIATGYAGWIWTMSDRAYTADFVQFFASARALRTGGHLYQPLRLADFAPAPAPPSGAAVHVHPNLSTPPLVMLVVPFTLTTLARGYLAWATLSLALGLTACAAVWRELRPAQRPDAALIWLWIAFLAYFPTYSAIKLGQVTFLALLPVTGAWLAARHGRNRTAGALLGLAVVLKPFALVLPGLFALRRQWRIVAWCAGTIAIVVAATLPVVGIEAYRGHIRLLGSVTWFGNSWNASFAAVVTRALGGSENVPAIDAPRAAQALTAVFAAASLLWLAWLAWPRTANGRSLEPRDLEYGLAVVLMLLVSPLGWMYYFPLLLVPGYILWAQTRCGRMPAVRWGLVLAWALSAVPTSMVRADDAGDPLRWFTLSSVYFYALLVMAAALSYALIVVEAEASTSTASRSRRS